MTTACYGLTCPVHAQCARYHAVESAGADDMVISSCETTDHKRPGFRLLPTTDTAPAPVLAAEHEGADLD